MADELIPTNKLQYARRTVIEIKKDGKEIQLKKLFLQQLWVSPFVGGNSGEWRDVPVTGKWRDKKGS